MSRSPNYRRRRQIRLALRYLFLTLAAVLIVFPLYLIFLDSMLSVPDITHTPPVLFSTHLDWSIFTAAWHVGDLGHGLYISIVQTSLIVSGQLLTSILAGFSFAYLRFPFKQVLYYACLATLMVPLEVTLATNLRTVDDLKLFGNMGGLVVPFLATGFGIFLLRAAFEQIPKEMHEAAVIDGYSNVKFLWRVAVPLARPTIAALGVFSFLGAWNSYLWPLMMSSNNAAIQTLQIQIKTMASIPSTANLQIAAAAITVLPLLIILLLFQKQLIRSLGAGAIK